MQTVTKDVVSYAGLWYVAVPYSADADGKLVLEAGHAVGLRGLMELSSWKRHQGAIGAAGFVAWVVQVGVSVSLLEARDWTEGENDRTEDFILATANPDIFCVIAEAIKSRVEYERDRKEGSDHV